ncbi:helix-turn-helix domain-containing protein [Rhodococcus erythropolis]|uniref:helix-turn-helix domain-containing protein n=1 Tax=Rhodococcus erythropolis TaxID=1833 RepID=UPI001BE81DEA|nr:helix-turn-helix transcriptional regulator [Rhodococcus erythropolis]MBT2268815.1 helix-turn-helix transcriptional regulator [Rhodococcus erythropolis]
MGAHEESFRRRVKHEREERGWSQADLARKLNEKGGKFHASTIAKIENLAGDKPRSIRLDEAMQIASAFDMGIENLLGYAIDPKYSTTDMIRRVEKTMTEISIEVQNRTSQLVLERATVEQIYRRLREETDSLVEAVVQSEFGEIYSDEPEWNEAVSSEVVGEAVDDNRAQILQVLMTWASLRKAIENFRTGTSYLSSSWSGVHRAENIEPLITDFKYVYASSPELKALVSIEELRQSGLLHSRYDEFEMHDDVEA